LFDFTLSKRKILKNTESLNLGELKNRLKVIKINIFFFEQFKRSHNPAKSKHHVETNEAI